MAPKFHPLPPYKLISYSDNKSFSAKCCTLNRIIIFFSYFFLILTHAVAAVAASSEQFCTQSFSSSEQFCNRFADQYQHQCSKLPPSISQTLVHYATTNITPQQTLAEISVTERVLRRKSPCNFLVFGLGYDSLMWAALNHGGRTLFLEENSTWIERMHSVFLVLSSHHVTYDTKVRDADDLYKFARGSAACCAVVDPRESECPLALRGLPEEVYEVEWDVIMIDAPTGYDDEAPGKMTAIYTAGLMARNRRSGKETEVMVHNVDRPLEDRFSKAFLCEGYVKEEKEKLRRFVVPSHRDRPAGTPFCPEAVEPMSAL